MTFIKKNIGVLFVIIFAVLASLPLFQPGFFPMHDDEQIGRLFDLNQALSQGQFPPRIAPNLGYGYGYPFFNFYPSFAYYVGEAFHIMGFGFIVATKLMLFTGFLLAAFFAYLLGRELFGRAGGIVAAAFYTFAPYHAVDIYVRGAFAEFFSFVFIPAIFWATAKLSRTGKIFYSIPLALSITFLILSHNLIFIMTVPFLIAWAVYLFFQGENRKQFAFWFAISFLIGFGMSAYFSLPSYFERNFTLVRILTSELADYNLHFVCIPQIFHSAWGYGGSISSCADGLSFEVGKVHLLAALFAIVLFCFYYVKHATKKLLIIPFFFVALFTTMFLMVRDAKIIWDLIPPLSYIQFPWRFLTLAVFFSSILAGSVVLFIKNKKLALLATSALVIAVVAFNLRYFVPKEHNNAKDDYYVSIDKIRWDTSNLAYEYVPESITTKKSDINTTIVDINKNEVATAPFTIEDGDLQVTVAKNLPQEKIFDINSTQGGILRIATYSFPGWDVQIDGAKTNYTNNNKLSLIEVKIPAGKHTVSSVFANTPIRTFGNLISVISIIGLCLILAMPAINKKRLK